MPLRRSANRSAGSQPYACSVSVQSANRSAVIDASVIGAIVLAQVATAVPGVRADRRGIGTAGSRPVPIRTADARAAPRRPG